MVSETIEILQSMLQKLKAQQKELEQEIRVIEHALRLCMSDYLPTRLISNRFVGKTWHVGAIWLVLVTPTFC